LDFKRHLGNPIDNAANLHFLIHVYPPSVPAFQSIIPHFGLAPERLLSCSQSVTSCFEVGFGARKESIPGFFSPSASVVGWQRHKAWSDERSKKDY